MTWASFSADGKALWTGGADGKLRSWDALTFAPRGGLLDHGNAIEWADVSEDGRRAVTACRAGRGKRCVVRLWDLVEGKPVGGPLLEKSFGTAGRFLPGGRVVVTTVGGELAGGDAECWRHDAEDGRPLGPPLLRAGWSWGQSEPHPNGRSFLTLAGLIDNGASPSPRQWDSLTGQRRGLSPPFPVAAAAFHPSGRFIAVAASENVRLWSLETGKPIGPPLPHPSATGVAFHPDGRLLATWSHQEQTARLWKLSDPVAGSPAEVKRRVEALTGQELDEAGNPRELERDEREKRQRGEPLGDAIPAEPGK